MYHPVGNPSLSPRDEAELAVRMRHPDGSVVLDIPVLAVLTRRHGVSVPKMETSVVPLLRGGPEKRVELAVLDADAWTRLLVRFSDVPQIHAH